MRKIDIVFILPEKEEHVGTTYGQISEVLKQFEGRNKLLVYDSENPCAISVVENLNPVICDTSSHLVTHPVLPSKWLLEFVGPHSKNSKLHDFKAINKEVPDDGVLILLLNLPNILAYAALAALEWSEISFFGTGTIPFARHKTYFSFFQK